MYITHSYKTFVIGALALSLTIIIACKHEPSLAPSSNTGTTTTTISKMPKSTNQLPQCELNKIQAWIKRGALNN